MDQSLSSNDLKFMARAVSLSRRGFPAPNPHVGCVIAHGHRIVGEGFHDYRGGPHAEVVALDAAGSRAKGATCYVTLEPCNHHGRTPPCTDALLRSGVRRVVIAMRDPIPGHGGGLERLEAEGIRCSLGALAEEARSANEMWLTALEKGRPFIVLKAAMTLDGRIATPSGESKWITGERARRKAHRLRAECGAVLVGRTAPHSALSRWAECGAVLVGRTTVERDDPRLTARGIGAKNQPLRIVLDPSRKLVGEYRVFNVEAPSLRVVSGESSAHELAVDLQDGRLDLKDLAEKLFDRGVTSLLVEGGGETIGGFMDAGLADRLELFIAAKVLGAGGAWIERKLAGGLDSASRFEFARVRKVGDDLWLTLKPIRETAGSV